MKNETWKPVIGYESDYFVSDLGRVKSLKLGKERILVFKSDTEPYKKVTLLKNGKQKTAKVHRLVYEAFNGETDLSIDHIVEGNRSDNRLCNLQAITTRENISKYSLTLNKSSKFTGVSFKKHANKWEAYINIKCKKIHLGYYNTELEASNAYQKKLKDILNTNESN